MATSASDISSFWHRNTDCQHRKTELSVIQAERTRDANTIVSCLSRYRRIVLVGDSVQRGLFWSLHRVMLEAGSVSTPQLNVTISKNFVQRGSYTNFQDQDMIVSARDTGKEIFSVRFIYGSNAVDWPSRCPTIKKWFFQCLKSMSEIFELVVDERSRFDRFRKQLKGVDSDSDDHNIDRVETEERGKIRGRQNLEAMEHPVGLLYWNTGLWDWRTGRSAEEFKNDMIELLKRAQVNRGAFSPGFAKRVVWRSTSASWPSKFITGKECENKPHDADDSRPCSVHTDGIIQYNSYRRQGNCWHGKRRQLANYQWAA